MSSRSSEPVSLGSPVPHHCYHAFATQKDATGSLNPGCYLFNSPYFSCSFITLLDDNTTEFEFLTMLPYFVSTFAMFFVVFEDLCFFLSKAYLLANLFCFI